MSMRCDSEGEAPMLRIPAMSELRALQILRIANLPTNSNRTCIGRDHCWLNRRGWESRGCYCSVDSQRKGRKGMRS